LLALKSFTSETVRQQRGDMRAPHESSVRRR
jgi:hypothetical protein